MATSFWMLKLTLKLDSFAISFHSAHTWLQHRAKMISTALPFLMQTKTSTPALLCCRYNHIRAHESKVVGKVKELGEGTPALYI